MLVKICGIDNLEDALLSIDSGANALGFNFYPRSPRYIEAEKARQILLQLPKGVLKVAVVVVGWPATIPDLFEVVQVHGARSEADLDQFKPKRVWAALSPSKIDRFPGREIIVDSSWGQGRRADWKKLQDQIDRPYILAGGLSPDNVADALKILSPEGVDVCSGVESSPGHKDPQKLRRFCQEASLRAR